MGLIVRNDPKHLNFASDRSGIAAVEFALIAPALIFLVMGVLEMSLRFRAADQATRYVHQVADLIARESTLATDELNDIYKAAPNMMMPLDTTDKLDLDVSSIAFVGDEKKPTLYWRRVAGKKVDFEINDAADMGMKGETVVRVGIRYKYDSVLTTLFGGSVMQIEREAYTRPRIERVITLDGASSDDGEIKYFGNS